MARDIEALLDDMTLEEQVSLLSGADNWALPELPRLGIGRLRVTDGPNGARGGGSLFGGVKSASFPVGIALGATWSPVLVAEIGAAIAEEVRSKGAQMLLGPTVNIQRSVTNGRNFECYSEDPMLSALIVSAYIRGLQSGGVAATMKHFAGNETEIERTSVSSIIDERTLREVYLLPFEWAVKTAGALGVMTAYNRLNGTFASEHHWLMEEVLRGEWGFEGLVMSDWFGSHSTAPTVNAGLDLEMPGPTRDRGDKLLAAVAAGEVSAGTIRDRARAVLTVMAHTGAMDNRGPLDERAEDRPAHRALIRRAGAEGAVLLKNDGILPLTGTGTRIAVIGPNAKVAQIMGGGSAQLNPHYRVSPWDGLVGALGEGRLSYAEGCSNFRFEPLLEIPFEVEYFANADLAGPPAATGRLDEGQVFWMGEIADGKVDRGNFSARLTARYTPAESGIHHAGIISAGYAKFYIGGKLVADAWTGWKKGRTFFEEGCDEVRGEVALEAGKPVEIVIEFRSKPSAALGLLALRAGIALPLGDAALERAAEAAKAADVALVFVGRSGEWDTEGSDLEDIVLPGRQNELVSAVAAANPRTVVVLQTGGPVEMPWLGEVAAVLQAWYPGQEAGNAIADVLLGTAEPGGRLPQTFPVKWTDNPTATGDARVYPGRDGEVEYREGVFIGHRHYARHGIEPLFPFGFGLSYTRFAFGEARIDDSRFEDAREVRVVLPVTNTGTRPGTAVVQLYVSPAPAPVPRPAEELKAFAKLALAPGETAEAVLDLDARAFAFFDVASGGWAVEPGSYGIRIGTSAGDTREAGQVTCKARLALPR